MVGSLEFYGYLVTAVRLRCGCSVLRAWVELMEIWPEVCSFTFWETARIFRIGPTTFRNQGVCLGRNVDPGLINPSHY